VDKKRQEAYEQEVRQLAEQSEKDFNGESKPDNTVSKNTENAANGSKNVNTNKKPSVASPKTPQKTRNEPGKQR
jgi:hypothetical protein